MKLKDFVEKHKIVTPDADETKEWHLVVFAAKYREGAEVSKETKEHIRTEVTAMVSELVRKYPMIEELVVQIDPNKNEGGKEE